MRRLTAWLAAVAAATALGSHEIRAQAAADTARIPAPAERVPVRTDTARAGPRASDSAAVRLVPAKRLSPGGVRIRSVRDNRRVIILAPSAGAAGARSPADSAFRSPGATREDLERLEARLQNYFDRRILDLEASQRAAFLSLYPPARGAAGPAGSPGPRGGTGVVIVPFAAPSSASADSAARDTLRGELAALGPGASVVEIERAMLDAKLLRTVSILFELDRTALLPASITILNSIGYVLGRHPQLRLEIRGHTDSSGPDEYNVWLSQARAEAVRDYLVATFSIGAERLAARGYGETRPIADESTATGRALNRRVEFAVLRWEITAE